MTSLYWNVPGFTTAWWRHQMKIFSALLAICAGNSPVTGEFPRQRPVTQSFDVYFDLRPNKRLSKQSWGWWFETPSRPLWRHRNGLALNRWYRPVAQIPQCTIWEQKCAYVGTFLLQDDALCMFVWCIMGFVGWDLLYLIENLIRLGHIEGTKGEIDRTEDTIIPEDSPHLCDKWRHVKPVKRIHIKDQICGLVLKEW